MATKNKSIGPAVIEASKEARKLASAILEVLSGIITPTDASEMLGVSLPRYYVLELRAINGLIAACEPRPKGRVQSEKARIAELENEVRLLKKETVRQQAVIRSSQRAIGLPRAPAAKKNGKRRRKNKPRGMKVVAMLKKQDAAEPATGE